jgi:hypothetical protein
MYEGYSESNFLWAVNKTSHDKKLLYTKNTYILKLLLNAVTVEIKTLVVLRNTFLHACVKEVCRMWAQPRFDIFHQLLITVEALWSEPALQVGKQVVVARREIKWSNNSQLKCSRSARVRAAVCRRVYSWRSNIPDVSIPRLLFWMTLRSFFSVSKYISDVIIVPCCMNSTIRTHFLS